MYDILNDIKDKFKLQDSLQKQFMASKQHDGAQNITRQNEHLSVLIDHTTLSTASFETVTVSVLTVLTSF